MPTKHHPWISKSEAAVRYQYSLRKITEILNSARATKSVHFIQTRCGRDPKGQQFLYLQEDLDKFITQQEDANQARWMHRDQQEKHSALYGNKPKPEQKKNIEWHSVLLGACGALFLVGLIETLKLLILQ